MPHQTVGSTPPNKLYKPSELSFWGNQWWGDCCTAEEFFAKACHTPEIFLPQWKAGEWAKNHGVRNGAELGQILHLMASEGIEYDGNTYLDGPARSVDWTDVALLQNAISIGPVKLGVSGDPLEAVWKETNGWFATGLQGGPQDHCVSLCGYGTMGWLAQQLDASVPSNVGTNEPGWGLFTWSTIGILNTQSLLAITGEAWIRQPTTIIKADADEAE
jgi:hypothetical protein